LPDSDFTIVILKQDIFEAATAVEIGSAFDVPARAGVADHCGTNYIRRSIHLPNPDFPAVVLKQDVRVAVAIKIAGALRVGLGRSDTNRAAPASSESSTRTSRVPWDRYAAHDLASPIGISGDGVIAATGMTRPPSRCFR
jgi:hypothetical protein